MRCLSAISAPTFSLGGIIWHEKVYLSLEYYILNYGEE